MSILNKKHNLVEELKNAVAESSSLVRDLRAKVWALAHDEVFGVWTRPGLELIKYPQVKSRVTHVIVLDVDHMHDLNDDPTKGYEWVNERIKFVLSLIRSEERSGDVTASRWFSGDELVVLCTSSLDKVIILAQRLCGGFVSKGMSATFAVVRSTGDLKADVDRGLDLIRASKHNGVRGVILTEG